MTIRTRAITLVVSVIAVAVITVGLLAATSGGQSGQGHNVEPMRVLCQLPAGKSIPQGPLTPTQIEALCQH